MEIVGKTEASKEIPELTNFLTMYLSMYQACAYKQHSSSTLYHQHQSFPVGSPQNWEM
jgi:hypothetical protein